MFRTFVCATVALLAPVAAQSLTLLPTADAHTDSSNPTTNFGSDPELSVGKDRDASGTAFYRRAHVLFDLSPAQTIGRVPLRATYSYYQARSSGAGCLDVSLHRLQAPWSEATLAWASQPAHDPAVVTTACVGDNFSPGWKSFDVTDLVRDWLAGVQPNHGLVVRDVRESSAGASRPSFGHSRENGNPALQPRLEIEWADLFGTPCSSRALFPMIDIGGGRAAPGDAFVLRSNTVIAGSQAFVVFGVSRTTWAGRALPFSLAFAGLPGCSLNVSADVTAGFGAIAGSPWDLRVPLPADPMLVGQTLYAQTMFQTPIPGFEASAGLGIEIGD